MQGKEVVALDDKIIRTREMLHWMLALFVVTLEVGEHFWLGEAVHLVGSQRLVPKISVRLASSLVCPPSSMQSL